MTWTTTFAFPPSRGRPVGGASGSLPPAPPGCAARSTRAGAACPRSGRPAGRRPAGPARSGAGRRLLAAALLCAAPAGAAADGRPEYRGAGCRAVGTETRVLQAPVAQEVGRPNFSGWWTLDPDATTLTPPAFSGGRGGADIDRLFITHAANGTVIVGPETNGLKAWSYTPGREGTIPVGRDTTMRAASRWDGARLVAEGTQGDLRMHEVMSLNADGSRLTIEVTTTTPEGVTTNTLVYRKDRPVGACGTWAMPCRDFTDQQR